MRTLLLGLGVVSYALREWAAKMGMLALLSTVLYLGLYAAPGAPLSSGRLSGEGCWNYLSGEYIERVVTFLRLDQPFPLNYGLWMVGEDWLAEVGQPGMQRPACQADPTQCQRGLLRHDFGRSWSVAQGLSVLSIMEQRQGNTLLLLGASILFSLLVAIPIGLATATRPASGASFAFFNLTIPLVCLSLLLIVGFGGSQSLWYRWTGLPYLPVGSSMLLAKAPAEGSLLALLGQGWDSRGSWLDSAVHLILPMLTLSAAPITQWSRALHEAIAAALRHDALRMAPGKGLRARAALYRCALRDASPALLHEVHRTLPALVSALLIVEIAFNWQGMGQIYIRALGSNDYPVAIAFLLISAELLLITSLFKEVLDFFLSRQKSGILAISN